MDDSIRVFSYYTFDRCENSLEAWRHSITLDAGVADNIWQIWSYTSDMTAESHDGTNTINAV